MYLEILIRIQRAVLDTSKSLGMLCGIKKKHPFTSRLLDHSWNQRVWRTSVSCHVISMSCYLLMEVPFLTSNLPGETGSSFSKK